MIFADTKKYDRPFLEDFRECIAWAETKYRCEILFAAVASSRAMGMDNSASDIDVYLMTNNRELASHPTKFLLRDSGFDGVIYSLPLLIRNSNDYFSHLSSFPSVLARNNLSENCWKAETKTTQKVFEVLISDCVFDSGYLRENLPSILKTLPFQGLMDYYYCRAYGNLMGYLNEGKVPAVRYLRTFFSIAVMEHLLKHKTVPYGSLPVLMEQYAPRWLRERLDAIWREHQSLSVPRNMDFHTALGEARLDNGKVVREHMADKPLVMVTKDDEINAYFEKRLTSIRADFLRAENAMSPLVPRGESVFFTSSSH